MGVFEHLPIANAFQPTQQPIEPILRLAFINSHIQNRLRKPSHSKEGEDFWKGVRVGGCWEVVENASVFVNIIKEFGIPLVESFQKAEQEILPLNQSGGALLLQTQ